MTLIDFMQLWMLDTVVLSCENIANKVTVLRLLTSSRRISLVRRRCYCIIMRQLPTLLGRSILLEASYNRVAALRTILHMYEIRVKNSKSFKRKFLRLLKS